MMIPLRNLGPQRVMKALIALALCYVMAVESLAAHMTPIGATADGLHQMCLSDAAESHNRKIPEEHSPSHGISTLCCLIFGSGVLPRPTSVVSLFVFPIYLTPDPTSEFITLTDQRIIFSQSLPRAPPHFG